MAVGEDKYQELARKELFEFFNETKNKEKVFYSRQLEVMYEKEYFHWITNRAIRELLEVGEINRLVVIILNHSAYLKQSERKFIFNRRTCTNLSASSGTG